jgi:hypothetical protein
MNRAGSIRIGAPVRTPGAITAEVQMPGDPAVPLRFAGADEAMADGAESLLATVLLPAMRLGATLRSTAPVSPELVANTARIQALLHGWDPSMRRVDVHAPTRRSLTARSTGAGAFFSCGVDSFHTALRHRDALTGLIFVHGFDIDLQARRRRAAAAQNARAAAAELGLVLVEVETDARPFARPYLLWNQYHGAVLASVALLLTPLFGTVHLPGSLSYDTHFPHGSHPLLDPLWSTEQMELRYDGFDANRWEKIKAVARSEVALGRLRVCSRDERGENNCGRCEKCLRTMVPLHLLGLLADARRFPRSLDLELVARAASRGGGSRAFWEQNLAVAEQTGDGALVRTIRAALARDDAQTRGRRTRLTSPTRPVARLRQLR